MEPGYIPIVDSKDGEDLVRYAGVSEWFLRDLIKKGELKVFRPYRGKTLVRREWWDEWVEEHISEDPEMDQEVEELAEKILGRTA